MTTAIVGVGNIGSAVARHLVAGGEPVILTAKGESAPQALAEELGPLARAASVEDAISAANAVLFAVWLDVMTELIPAYAGLLAGKVVIDPSNPVGSDAAGQMARTLPDGDSSGSVVAALLPRRALRQGLRNARRGRPRRRRQPRPAGRAVLRHRRRDRRDDRRRLIRAAGYEPWKAGGVAAAGRIEMPGGTCTNTASTAKLVDINRARSAPAAPPPERRGQQKPSRTAVRFASAGRRTTIRTTPP